MLFQILPGWILPDLSIIGEKHIPGIGERYIANTPAGRAGHPIDLAGTAVFFACPASDFVTGVMVAVDGGYSVRG